MSDERPKLYRERERKPGLYTMTSEEFCRCLFAAEPCDRPPHPHTPTIGCYCSNEDCDVREVEVSLKYLDGPPPRRPPAMKCPRCGGPLEQHHYLRTVTLVPEPESEPGTRPETKPERLPEEEAEVYLTLYRLFHGRGATTKGMRENWMGRQLVCTPFEGSYGVAGWVVCVNGSPPRATAVFLTGSEAPDVILFWDGNKARKLPWHTEQVKTLWGFWKRHLKEAKGPRVLLPPPSCLPG